MATTDLNSNIITGTLASLGIIPSSDSTSSSSTTTTQPKTGFFKKVGNFFKNLFSKKTDTTSTTTDTGSAGTPPINSNQKFDLGNFLISVGTIVGGIIGSKSTTTGTNTDTGSGSLGSGDVTSQEEADAAKKRGRWVIIGVVTLLVGALGYVLYRKKSK